MALTRGIFPRDEQGNLLTKQGCPTCDHPNWHVCLVGKQSEFGEAVQRLQTKLRQKKKRNHPGASDEQLQALADGRDARWEQYREDNRERDQEICRRYRDDKIGLRQLSVDFGISYQAVRNALIYYNIPIRSKGTTLKNGAE